jgi:hypothetical protein
MANTNQTGFFEIVSSTELIPILVNSIKEVKNSFEEEITKLKEEIRELKSLMIKE